MERFSFHKEINISQSQVAFLHFLDTITDGIVYEYTDDLTVSIMIFSVNQTPFLVGPFIKSVVNDEHCHQLLANNHLSGSYLLSLKHYFSSLSILSSYHIIETLNHCLHAFNPLGNAYTYHRIKTIGSETTPVQKKSTYATVNYDDIFQRYELENHFMDMITTGNVNAVTAAFSDVSNFTANLKQKSWKHFNTDFYTSMSGIAIIRTLARKAAEKSGLSVVIIDEITQRSAKKITPLMDVRIAHDLYIEMILELTQAVQDYLIHTKNYSPLISRAVGYLTLHYSEDCTLIILSDKLSVSPSHLSRQFKKETGDTLSDYIAKYRCQKAEKLLRTSDWTIAAISEFVGYLDNNYFVKVFKKHYDQTPSAYRKMLQG